MAGVRDGTVRQILAGVAAILLGSASSASPDGWVDLPSPEAPPPLERIATSWVAPTVGVDAKPIKRKKGLPGGQSGVLSVPRGQPTDGVYAAEVEDLARALDYEVADLFSFVLNEIGFQPYAGLRQGSAHTLRSLRANDYDQANLLVELLRASGYSADFARVQMVVPLAVLADWMDVAVDSDRVWEALAVAGIPLGEEGPDYRVERIIVALEGATGPIYLDPALVSRQATTREEFFGFLDYDRSALVAVATAGAQLSRDSVSGLDEEALGVELDRLAENLALTLAGQYGDRTVEELFGDRPQIPVTVGSTVAEVGYLPVGIFVLDTLASLASSDRVTVTLSLGAEEQSWFADELLDRRISVGFPGRRPTLYLDGEVVIELATQPSESAVDFAIAVDHPHPANGGTFADFDRSRRLTVDSANFYVVPFGFDRPRSSPTRAQQAIALAVESGTDPADEPVVAGAQFFVGQTYARSVTLADGILGYVLGTQQTIHANFGIVSYEDGRQVIDWIGYSGSTINRFPGADQRDQEIASFVGGPILSALEHAVIDQYLGERDSAMSTTKSIVLQNRRGGTIHRIDAQNLAELEPVLRATYPDSVVDGIASSVGDGAWVLLPENGAIALGDWSGYAYYRRTSNSYGFLISGGLNGGHSAIRKTIQEVFDVEAADFEVIVPYNRMAAYDRAAEREYLLTSPAITSEDPVDMSTGHLTDERLDLQLGGDLPTGLRFGRTYNSGLSDAASVVGRGWTHSLEGSWSIKDMSFPLLGDRSVLDLAPALTYAYVSRDLLDNMALCTGADCATITGDTLAYTLAFLAGGWLTDQFIGSAVEIRRGQETGLYVKLPGGRYAPPPGLRHALARLDDGSYELTLTDESVMEYDAEGRYVGIRDTSGNRAELRYDADGRLERATDAYGRWMEFSYGEHGLASVTDSSDRTVRYTVDGAGLLTEFRDGVGGHWSYAYTPEGKLSEIEDPRGIVVARNRYDTEGRVVEQDLVRQAGYATYRFGYSRFASWEEDPDGFRLRHRFDARGRGIRSADALGYVTETEYSELDLATAVRDKGGFWTRTEYDPRRNPVKVTDPLGHVSEALFDHRDNAIALIDALGNATRFEWDERSLNTATITPLGHRRLSEFDERGREVEMIDANGVVTAFGVNAYGDRESMAVGESAAVLTQRDTRGNIVAVTNRAGGTASMVYDAEDRLVRAIDIAGNETRYSYDGAGNLVQVRRRDGSLIVMSFTPTNQLATVELPDGTTYSYTYDIHDRMTSVSGPAGITAYVYNARHEPIRRTDPFGLVTEYAYDPMGNVSRIGYPGGFAVDYTYDARQSLTRARDSFGRVTTFTHDAAERLTRITHPNGVTEEIAYDADGRVITREIRNGSVRVHAEAAGYDGVDNLVSFESTGPPGGSRGLASSTFGFDVESNRIAALDGVATGVDVHGRVTQLATREFSFDARDRLVSVTGGIHDLANTYDHRDQRIERIRDGEVRRFGYDESGRLLYEADETGAIVRYYVHGNGPLAAVEPSGVAETFHLGITGNLVLVTDEAGAVRDRPRFGPFGRPLPDSWAAERPYGFHAAGGAVADTPHILIMGARTYDVVSGRFLTEDPIGMADDLNLYRFVANNPLTYIDPTGLARLRLNPREFRNAREQGRDIREDIQRVRLFNRPLPQGFRREEPGAIQLLTSKVRELIKAREDKKNKAKLIIRKKTGAIGVRG